METEVTTRHTCLKLQVPSTSQITHTIFVKGTWFPSRFDISITDGLHAWICNASEDEVSDRAAQWDQPVTEYIELAERYLGFQQPGSIYGFTDAGDDHKRLSWTFEKEGTKLEWRWKCKPSLDSKKTTADTLDFLMDANITLSEEVVRKSQSSERLKVEAEKCLAQSEKFSNAKTEFELAKYAKFRVILNENQAKLRELRELVSKPEFAGKESEEEEASGDETDSYDDGSDDDGKDEAHNTTTTSKKVTKIKDGRGKRIIS